MRVQDYPLIFIVEDNFICNKFIVNYLRSNKLSRIESFLSEEECLKNLYKKPDIVIQDYLMNEMIDNNIQKTSKKSNLNTEFVFLSDLDNFLENRNQNTGLTSLSGSDNDDVALDTIKYGPHNYVVKDLFALNKLIEQLRKIRQFKLHTKYNKVSITLFLITLVLLIITLLW